MGNCAEKKSPRPTKPFERDSITQTTTNNLIVHPKSNPIVYFDVAITRMKKPIGRIVIEVRGNSTYFLSVWAPCKPLLENFRVLCTGQKGYSYKDSVFHRIVPNILCQGGDITNKNGTGGKSIYGKTFKDENFKLKHNARGVVSMANSGPNTNGSQFFICCGRVDEFDGKHVVVGKITDGFDVLTEIEQEGSSSGRVGNVITITNCGQLS